MLSMLDRSPFRSVKVSRDPSPIQINRASHFEQVQTESREDENSDEGDGHLLPARLVIYCKKQAIDEVTKDRIQQIRGM